MLYANDFLLLATDCFLKQLEELYVYNVATDELYETNAQAFDFLKRCDGSHRLSELDYEEKFLDFCLDEGILVLSSGGTKRDFVSSRAPVPSLRYLELQLTARCNLKCKHCYLGQARDIDLPTDTVFHVLHEFERMQGLRLLLSGGEPMLHPDFWHINEALPRFGFRSVLISNGTLIDREAAERIQAHEVQVSLDGVAESHDLLRGKGNFNKALTAIENLRRLGKDVSVATMVHAGNLRDFPNLESILEGLAIKDWNVDIPCVSGHLASNADLCVPYREAAPLLRYGYGGGLYSSAVGYACGAHLCAVLPDGQVAKCGFFTDRAVGHVTEGLQNCWQRIKPMKLVELNCDCAYKEECRGGCRYRALLQEDIRAPDPVQCYFRGVL